MLFGESIPAITLNKPPTTGAGLTRALKRAEDSYKLCLGEGKAQGTDPKRHQGTKGSAGCQGILQQQLLLAVFAKPKGCGCRSSVP